MCCTERSKILNEIALVLEVSTTYLDGAASFIAHGGDSLKAIRLQNGLRRLGLHLPFHWVVNKNPLSHLLERFSATPLDTCTCNHSILTPNMGDVSSGEIGPVLSQIVTEPTHLEPRGEKILRTYRSEWTPITDMQLALYKSTLARPGRNIISYCETHRTVDIPKLKSAWMATVNSEPIFRTRIDLYKDMGYAMEEEEAPFDWSETIIKDPTELDLEVARIINSYGGFGNRFRVITLDKRVVQRKSVIVWQIHHTLIDGYACNLIRSKVQRHLAGHKLRPGPSFVNFARDLNTLQQQLKPESLEYWKSCHAKVPSPMATLPVPRPGTIHDMTTQVNTLRRNISNVDITSYCRKMNITPAAAYHGAWALVLTTYMNSRQISFGTVLSGRTLPIPNVIDLVGPTMNTFPILIPIDANFSAQEYLDNIFASLAELSRFQWSVPSHGFSRDFSTAINVQLDGICSTDCDGLKPLEPPSFHLITDVPIYTEISTAGSVSLHYHTDMYSRTIAEMILDKFVLALDLLREGDTRLASCLHQLSSHDRPELCRLGNWISPSSRIGQFDEDLVTRLVRTSLRYPQQTAVQKRKFAITYWELHLRSTHVAKSLSQMVFPGDVVCVDADRSINWIIAIYAVLKAGAIYCPIDSSLPVGARDTIYETSKAVLFLTGGKKDEEIRPTACQSWACVEEVLSRSAHYKIEAEHFRIPKASPEAGAYLCFTSGSSGKPKGVLCRHAGLVAFQSTFEVRLCSSPGQKIAQIMSPGFDGSIHEIFSALGYGATLVLSEAANPMEHLEDATVAVMTPSLAKVLEPARLMNLKSVYLVGEAVTQEVCDAWAPGRNLYNMYGPTEATCGATIKRLQASHPVTLGSPNPTTRVYILDNEMCLAPLGAVGEICLAGVQVAVGYIGQPEATAKQFVPDLIHPGFGERMYRTGDRGYWSEEGELVFLGRQDRQIKLRGFRLDLDDLEVLMKRAAGCRDVAIALCDNYLVAQVQPKDFDMTAFQSAIQAHIPAYAVPRHVEAVETFPLTPIGKKDYRAISISAKDETTDYFTPSPNHAMINLVLGAVKDALSLYGDDVIDIRSNLFELGATSTICLSLSQRLSRLLNRKVPVRLLFESATLYDLTFALHDSHDPNEVHSEALNDHGVSPIEYDWWQKYNHDGGSSAFNVTFACDINLQINRPKLVAAWNIVLARHRILRCRYRLSRWHGVCRTYAEKVPTVVEMEQFDIPTEIDKDFDLKSDDLVRVLVSPNSMLVVISHIICDLASLRMLLQEVADVYNDRKILDQPKAYSQTRWLTAASQSCFDFWAKYLSSPKGFSRSADQVCTRTTWAGTSYVCEIPAEIYAAMHAFTAERHITIHQLCLSAVALALQNDKPTCDITLGAPFLNRNSEEDQHVVGLFLEPLPIRIRYPDPASPHASFVDTVRASSQAAIANVVPWNLLLSHLNVTNDFPNHALFDTMVSFHDAQAAPEPLIDGLKAIRTWASGAKFPLMAEFSAEKEGSLWMRLEYSTECFSAGEINELSRLLVVSLQALAGGEEAFSEPISLL